MALIGSITNQGELQGQINGAKYLTGVITNAALLGGQVVGMRGLKGDKGDKGDTGDTGAAGADGYSPSATVVKVGDTTTITITDKDGTTTASIEDEIFVARFGVTSLADVISAYNSGRTVVAKLTDSSGDTFAQLVDVSFTDETHATFKFLTGDSSTPALDMLTLSDSGWSGYYSALQTKLYSGTSIKTINNESILGSGNIDIQGGGASAFIAEYGVTSYSDIDDAYSSGQSIVCRYDDGEFYTHDLTFADVNIYGEYRFLGVVGYSVIKVVVGSNGNWSKTTYDFASQDLATIYVKGLMSSTDKSKLDGIASGAEVNVQSDWNQSTNTADDYIKNKPTIPSKTSDLNNDSGFITSSSLPSNLSDLNNDMDVSDFPNDAGYITSAHEVPSGGSSGQVLSKGSNDDYDLAWTTVASGGGEIAYCTCTDSASTVAKTATLVNGSFDSLTTGAQVAVKFTYTNTATNPTLNVNNTGAKGIRRGGTTYVGTNTNESWGAGNVVILVYDGTDWQVANWLNTTYTGGTGAEIISGSLALNKVWSPEQIHDGIDGMATATPTASKNSKFDSDAHMNSTDMDSDEIDDFIDGLNVNGGGYTYDTKSNTSSVSMSSGTVGTYANRAEIDCTKVGYKLIGAYLKGISNPASYHACVTATFTNPDKVYVSLYRTLSSAVTVAVGEIVIVAMYVKE